MCWWQWFGFQPDIWWEQLLVYEEAETASRDTESGQDEPKVVDVSSTPDVANDGDAAPPSSLPVGPAGPVTCNQDFSSAAPSPVLAGPHTLAGVVPVPAPPPGPYEDFSCRSGRLPLDSGMSVPQPAAVVLSPNLVMLPSALPRPFPTFQGPGLPPRAPSPAPGSRKLLLDSCYAAPCHTTQRLARFFCHQVPLHRHARQDLPAFGHRPACLLDTKCQNPLRQLPHLLSFLCIFPGGCHALPDRYIDAPDPDRRSGLDTGLTGRLLPVYARQDDEYVGCCSTPANRGSLYSPAEYGPNGLRQLSPSGDQEAPWAQPKFGSKRADGSSLSRSPSGDRSLPSKDGRSHRQDSSPSSSSDRLSPPSNWLRPMSRSPGRSSCSHNDRWHSPGPRRHRASPQSTASCRSRSPAPRRRPRTRPSLSRRSSPASMTRRPTRDVSLSPRRRSPSSLAWRSSRGRRTSPRTRRMSPNHHGRSSCSRSSTPRPNRRPR